MTHISHLPHQQSCPYLPVVSEPLRAVEMRALGSDRGVQFYQKALEVAQSLWLQGLPAQSILLMNRAFGADLTGRENFLIKHPLPYEAMAWVMKQRQEEQFIGNPRRHFQHLATRMVPPRREIRSWRAWACWAIACEISPDLPADHIQIQEEGIEEPEIEQIEFKLSEIGLTGESQLWLRVYSSYSSS